MIEEENNNHLQSDNEDKHNPVAGFPLEENKEKLQDASFKLQETSNEQPETLNSKSEIRTMEVHHHAHHEGKKNWKSYFWEFLMLFLAVFCGFLAEYELEHIVEHNREKQYIESMVHDIVEDTVKMSKGINQNTIKIAGIDSLINNILTTPYTDSSLKKMYQLINHINTRSQVDFTKRTITQLKNSGGLRLIRNMAASDSIVSYDEACSAIEKQFDVAYWHQLKARDFQLKIFDPRFRYNWANDKKYRLLNPDEKLMMEFVNWVGMTKSSHSYYVKQLKINIARAINTIEFLKNEYHLENE